MYVSEKDDKTGYYAAHFQGQSFPSISVSFSSAAWVHALGNEVAYYISKQLVVMYRFPAGDVLLKEA